MLDRERAPDRRDGGGRGRETFQMTVQHWRPTKAKAEFLVDMLTARLAPAKIAESLYKIDMFTG
jgi:hypothetical protein